MKTPRELIDLWLKRIGSGANDSLELEVKPGRARICDSEEFRATVTSCSDWGVMLEAESVEALAALCEADLKACGFAGELADL